MTFAEKIEKHIRRKNIIEIGEIRVDKAYLYSSKYEIYLECIPKRKIYRLSIKMNEQVLLHVTGTLSHVFHTANGFVFHY